MTNAEIARQFEQVARLLREQKANLYRVHAYRRAAEALHNLDRLAQEILLREGEAGLRQLPGIGRSLVRAVNTLVVTGHLPILEQLQGEADPLRTLA